MSTLSAPNPGSGISSHPHVFIIILNWNSHEDTIASVKSALKTDYPSYHIAIIDNGSEPHSVKALEALVGDRVQLARLPENRGYTGGCNRGFDLAQQAGADYVWLLNNDAVTQPGTLSSLVHFAETDSRIALASPLVASRQKPDEVLSVCGIFDPNVPSYNTTKNLALGHQWVSLHPERITLLGTALLVRTSAIRQIGGFDQDFFAYWEDTDLCLRSIKAGLRNAVDFNSTIYHSMDYPSASSPGVWPHEAKPHFWYYMARNETHLWRKHAPWNRLLNTLWWAYRKQLGHLKLLADSPLFCQAILAGLWDGWMGRTGAWNQNRRMPGLIARAVTFHSRRFTS